MALFSGKKGSTSAEEADSSDLLADSAYRKELQELGKAQFKELIASQSSRIESQMDAMMDQVASDVRGHISRRVDMLMGRLNAEITNQLNERINEYNRVSGESQELVAQSLSRNAQMVHEKYQQLSLDLQRTVANQEVQMATVFQDSKTQIAAIQSQQGQVLEQLRSSEEAARRETEELTQALRQSVSDQAAKLHQVYEESLENVEAARSSQAATLNTLSDTTEALQAQYSQLSQLLDKSITEQKALIAEVIDENMARIVEHYLVGALGEQSNIREQMPSILQQMEENKQAMMEDMKL